MSPLNAFNKKNDYNKNMENYKKSLFELILKTSPLPGFLFNPLKIEKNIKSFDTWIETPNPKFTYLKQKINIQEIYQIVRSSLEYDHPSVFTLSLENENYFVIFIPPYPCERGNIRLGLLLENSKKTNVISPLLKESSWHEINNPLAIISLTLQTVIKKETLDQDEIDNLLKRLSENYDRIEKLILAEL
jgi:hypothetical protein